MDLITIDGSTGEGGGQVVRSAIALSAVLQQGVRIVNIRKARPRPGLGIQHVKSVELAGEMTGASIKGLSIGSSELEFIPGPIKSGDFTVRMGTAGSISLALQSILPIAAFAPGPVSLDITGGTDVKWSPLYDYFHNVVVPALELFGFHVETSLLSRGYFPEGNGRVKAMARPAPLHGIRLIEPRGNAVHCISASSRLPPHVALRQSRAATEYLASHGYQVGDVHLDTRNDASTGSGITLFNGFIGGSALGARGVPAEKVGHEAASLFAEEQKTCAAVDSHLADQLIIYMALARNSSSITASRITGHTLTGIQLARLMTGASFEVAQNTVIRS